MYQRETPPTPIPCQVYNRVVALAWLHLLASVALAVMAGIAGMGFEWAPQFASSQGAGIPLAAVCFLKVGRERERRVREGVKWGGGDRGENGGGVGELIRSPALQHASRVGASSYKGLEQERG